jgi:hypothetical protein
VAGGIGFASANAARSRERIEFLQGMINVHNLRLARRRDVLAAQVLPINHQNTA